MTQDIRIKNIAKNTSYLTLALIAQKFISFFYFIILARGLGPENLGLYYFAISFTTIFAIFIDLGLVNYLTRETAKKKDDSSYLLSNILGLKLLFSIATLLLVVLFASFINGHDQLTQQLIYISSICMILDSFTLSFFGSARGFHNLKFESLASVLFQFIVLSVGWFFLYIGLDLRFIMSSLVLASIFNFCFAYYILKYKIGVKIKLSFNRTYFKTIIVSSIPFALYGIFHRLYTYLDSVLLKFLAGDNAAYFVGIYQVSFKIIFALQFLPMAFIASLYPAMSYYWIHNKEQFLVSFKRAINYLLLVSIPISAAVFVLSDKILLVFRDSYSDANWPLKISIIALVFIFINFPIGSLLNACNKQSKNTKNMLISLFFSIILNIILIPHYQAIGASITVLLSSILLVILGIIEIKKIVDYKLRDNLASLIKIMVSAIAMSLLVYLLKNSINVFVLSIIGAIIYLAILIALGGIKKDEINYLLKMFKSQ